MGIDIETAKKIRAAHSLGDARSVLAPIVDERYQVLGERIKRSKEELETDWSKLAPIFWPLVFGLTEHRWLHSEYNVVVSAFHRGLSDWEGSRVAVGATLDRCWRLRIAAHEIVLSHVVQILRARYPRDVVPDTIAWAFAENTTVFILDDPRLRGFWPSVPPAGSYFKESNYPQLEPLEPGLLSCWTRRTSFQAYMDKAIKILEKGLRSNQANPRDSD
ncbi:MAG: hypothetical protein GXP49_04970 [Deltaproteobacteria bacterium]|nr:hypothetical protein [Deltaproteobacteria bacterium]